MGILVFIEAMHLLPQSFEFRRPTPPKGRLLEQRHSSSQPLFGSFRKACRTSSRGRLFRFCGLFGSDIAIGAVTWLAVGICARALVFSETYI